MFFTTLFLLIGLTFYQDDYTYRSDMVKFLPEKNYVMCDYPVQLPCPEVTEKTKNQIQKKAASINKNAFIVKPFFFTPLSQINKTKKIENRKVVVYFEFDSFVLKDTERKKLKEINKNSKLKITGYTDKNGSKQYNDRLAIKRALEVKKFLVGVNAVVKGKGKCCYISQKPAENRRVEVEYQVEVLK